MRSPLTRFALLLATHFVLQNSAYAGGCHLEKVTPSKRLVAQYMAETLRNKLLEVEKEMSNRGQNLQAVFVARSGESLDNFRIIPENKDLSLQDYLFQLADLAIANKNGELKDNRGHSLPPSKMERLPKSIYLDEKMQYSHLGLLIKKNKVIDSTKETVNDWIFIIDLLAECDETKSRYGKSDIFYHTFNEFFWDTKVYDKNDPRNKSIFIVPTPEIQERLFQLVHNKEIGTGGLHEPQYNVAATPFTLRSIKDRKKAAPDFHQLKDQNSNQWPLELLVAATRPVGEIRNRREAQDLLMQTNYHPSLLYPTGIKEANACSLKKGKLFWLVPLWDASNLLNCNDQVYRRQGILQLITVRSVIDYMSNQKLLAENVYSPNEPAVYEAVADKETLSSLDEKGRELERLDELFDPKKKSKKDRPK